jgi:transglycosylase-like protein with SLT domain
MPQSPSANLRLSRPTALVKTLMRIGLLSLLSACATHSSPQMTDESQEAAEYAKHAKGDYTPPGPPDDPWGPYIGEASKRFDVPERWIREVMRVESGGNEYLNGQLTTSPVGAMGLMQVMPQTYDELKLRYALGDDAYDPYNNILAGAAYIREMYDLYGAPAFLAAYNAGPGRVDDYMQHSRGLPAETRRYVAMIAPYIQDSWPTSRSAADALAMNLPGGFDYTPVPRFAHNPRGYAPPAVVLAEHRIGLHPYGAHSFGSRYSYALYASHRTRYVIRTAHAAQPSSIARNTHPRVEYAMLPTPPQPPQPAHSAAPAAHVQLASTHAGGFHLISQASAEALGLTHGAAGHSTALVGGGHEPARAALNRSHAGGTAHAQGVQQCVSHGHQKCVVVWPASHS